MDARHKMVQAARVRAKKSGIRFAIGPDDFCLPIRCPLLGIQIEYANTVTADDSPSLDRLDSSKGYIPGNVWVISFRANRIKNNASYSEFRTIAKNWARALHSWPNFSEPIIYNKKWLDKESRFV
jgi:hypothetical protein